MQSFTQYLEKIEDKNIFLYYSFICYFFPFLIMFFINGDESHFLSSLVLISPIFMFLIFTASYVCLYLFFENKIGENFKRIRYIYLLSIPIIAPLIYFSTNIEASKIINDEFSLDSSVFPNTLQFIQVAVFIKFIKDITIFLVAVLFSFFLINATISKGDKIKPFCKEIIKNIYKFKQMIMISIVNILFITTVASFMTENSYIIGQIAYHFDGNNKNMCGNLKNKGNERLFYINDNTRGFLSQKGLPMSFLGKVMTNPLDTKNKIILLDCEMRESFVENISVKKEYNEEGELSSLYNFTINYLRDYNLLNENIGGYSLGVKVANYQINDTEILNVNTYLLDNNGRVVKETYKDYVVNDKNDLNEESVSMLEISKMIERIRE